MPLNPSDVADLSHLLRQAFERKERVEQVGLGALAQIVEYHPEDMTATVQTGMLLSQFQAQLRAGGQWLPVDPAFPEQTTLHDLIAYNKSGPRLLGYGAIRDHLLGVQAVMADGTAIRSGGKVVKNVAGYDLLKLFVGAKGTLGVVTEASFKLRPLPEAEIFLRAEGLAREAAETLAEAVHASDLCPVVLDLHSFEPRGLNTTLTLGFAGTREEVEYQRAKAVALGFKAGGDLSHEERFWSEFGNSARRISVLPSKTISALVELPGPFVARLGNGLIYSPASKAASPGPVLTPLMRRVKEVFDPNRIFPDYSL